VETILFLAGAGLIMVSWLVCGHRYIRAIESLVEVPGGGRPRASDLDLRPLGFFRRAADPAVESARRRVIAVFVLWILYLLFAQGLIKAVLG
jgi:hypothetical protein